jgi:hypothetical protein
VTFHAPPAGRQLGDAARVSEVPAIVTQPKIDVKSGSMSRGADSLRAFAP